MAIEREYKFHDGKRGAAIAIRVVPRAKRDEVVKVLPDGRVRIRLKAPPVEGKANKALVDFLANILEIPRSKIEIVAGHKGRDKIVTILDLDVKTVQERLLIR